jgi:hypothetical protein
MQIARALEGQRIANSVRIRVVFGVVLKLFSESNLSGLSMFELVGKAGRRGNKVPKIGIERVVDIGNKYVRAEAGSRSASKIIPVDNGRCQMLQRVELMHPSSRLGMLISQYVRDLSVGVFGYS